jgi:adenylate cyclase
VLEHSISDDNGLWGPRMSGEGEESGETQPPTSAPETVQTPASAAVPQPAQRSGYGHGHPPIEFRFLDELKRRNVGRVAILYLVVCWLILEPVHVIFHMLEVPVWANRLVIILMALGFPAVTIFAWVYEITPEGLKPTAEIPHGQSIRRQTGRRIDRAIIIVLVLALTYFVVDKFWISKHALSVEGEKALNAPATAPFPAVISDKSIAVLPFADMSEKHDQEYFADGMAEEIIDLLAKILGLKVIGRTSSFQFKGKTDDLRRIGNALGVAYIVEGSLRRAGDRIRVTAQLINVQDGAHLWSETYDREVSDVLNMQAEIAASLARSLQIEVGGGEHHGSGTPVRTDAYVAYLQGLHSQSQFSRIGLEEAVSDFERALTLDPNLLRAREALAFAHFLQYGFGFAPPTAVLPGLRREIEEILRIDPSSVTGHGLRARILTSYDWDWGAAQREADLVLSLDPSSGLGLYAAADLALVLGRHDDAEKLFRKVLSADPLDDDTRIELAFALSFAGRSAEAVDEAQQVLARHPSYTAIRYDVGMALLLHGQPQLALREIQLETIEGVREVGLAVAYHALRRNAESDAAMRAAERTAGDAFPFQLACAYAYRGDSNAAFGWMEKAYAQRDYYLQYIKANPWAANLKDDPRYKAFLRKMNLPE